MTTAVTGTPERFIAHSVRNFLKSSEIKQDGGGVRLTHVATPEENSYIEAFHSILEHDVIERNEFASGYEAKEMVGRYFSITTAGWPRIIGYTVRLVL